MSKNKPASKKKAAKKAKQQEELRGLPRVLEFLKGKLTFNEYTSVMQELAYDQKQEKK